MATVTYLEDDPDGLAIDDGFLDDPRVWTAGLARACARRDGLGELTPAHWLIIRELREHYRRFGTAPPAFSHLCHRHHLGRHCVERLFGSEREAWRIAGLPDPGEETKAYML